MNMTDDPLYRTWESMKSRCYNINNAKYDLYGGRGIAVCSRWRVSFQHFLSDMGDKPFGHTLDRKNNDLGYSLENCRWATGTQQNINQRTSRLNTSGIRGVSLTKLTGRYETYINYKGTRYHLGHFDTLEEATITRKSGEEKYWGKELA